MTALKTFVDELYNGRTKRAKWFRFAMLAFDICSIAYFIAVTPVPHTVVHSTINAVLAVVIFLDFVARFWVAPDRKQHAKRVYVWADVIVLFSLVFNSFVPVDLSFLRILRGLRLPHSLMLLQDLRNQSSFFRRNEETVVAAMNLFVFVFATSSAVYAFFFKGTPGYPAYVDSMYFTVTTLTTTGYGDITPKDMTGKLVAIAIMVIGVSLFVQLARALVLPSKVRHPCPSCGLSRHDADAVHCKHCGEVVRIETGGAV